MGNLEYVPEFRNLSGGSGFIVETMDQEKMDSLGKKPVFWPFPQSIVKITFLKDPFEVELSNFHFVFSFFVWALERNRNMDRDASSSLSFSLFFDPLICQIRLLCMVIGEGGRLGSSSFQPPQGGRREEERKKTTHLSNRLKFEFSSRGKNVGKGKEGDRVKQRYLFICLLLLLLLLLFFFSSFLPWLSEAFLLLFSFSRFVTVGRIR